MSFVFEPNTQVDLLFRDRLSFTKQFKEYNCNISDDEIIKSFACSCTRKSILIEFLNYPLLIAI